jgi:hypothetical protein
MLLATLLLATVPSLPVIRYRVTCDPSSSADPKWRVEISVTGLDPKRRDVRFQLPGWGEWYDLDDYYVRELAGTPPVRHRLDFLERFDVELPADWDGTLKVSYAIPIVELGSRANSNHGLLPWRTAGYVHAFSSNTLMRVAAGEALVEAERTLELVPLPGGSSLTGWSGLAAGPQTVKLAPQADNTVLVLGVPSASQRSDDAGGLLEAVQFSGLPDCTKLAHDFARRLRVAYAATTGAPAGSAERLVLTAPGLGGTHVEGAITLGRPEIVTDVRGRPGFETGTAHFVAHELFHAWLPGVLKMGEPGLEWIHEGFTEYLSLWQLVALGDVAPDEFARRMHWYDELARKSAAFGKVAFASPDVNWREPENETIAYKGGCLLAFHLDALLRDAGEPGLPQLFRDFMREEGGAVRRAAFAKWLAAQGLDEAWANCCQAPFAPDPRADLLRAGFRPVEKPDPNDRHHVATALGGTTEPFFKFGK